MQVNAMLAVLGLLAMAVLALTVLRQGRQVPAE
jgi:hypothetical protein